MANNLKRSIAMLLVLNMLTGMIPAQALADEGDAGVVAAVVVHSETSSKEASSSSESGSSESGSSESGSSESSSSESSSSESSSSESSSSESNSSESSSSESNSSESSSSESSTEGGEPVPASETAEGGEAAPASVEEPKLESQLTTEGGDITVNEGEAQKSETTDEDGNTITTESQTTTTEGTLKGGEKIEGEETYTETTKTDPEGNEIQNEATLEGEETITSEDEEITPDDTDLPKVEVNIGEGMQPTDEPIVKTETSEDGSVVTETTTTVEDTEDGTKVIVNVTETTTEVDGDKASGNYSETETTIEREVTAEIGGLTTTEERSANLGLQGLPIKDFDPAQKDINSEREPSITNDLKSYFHRYDVTDEETGEVTTSWYPIVDRSEEEYQVLPDEIKAEYTKDEETGRYLPNSEKQWSSKDDGVEWDVVLSYVYESLTANAEKGESKSTNGASSLIMVYGKDGSLMSTYCMDVRTNAGIGYMYTIENLEEAGYFSGTPEEQELAKEHIRAIALNGYWGTESGEGSLQNLKDNLKAALEDPEFNVPITFTGRNNIDYNYDMSNDDDRAALMAMIDSISDGDAIAGMQYSVWAFGRSKDYVTSIFPFKAYTTSEGERFEVYPNIEDIDGDNAMAEARLELIRAFLTSDYLKDKVKADESKQETTIIDQDSFLTDAGITLTVGDKVQMVEDTTEDDGADYSANYDDNPDNDIYKVDLSFAMVVEPSTENGDDLVVKLIDAQGNVIRKARIAGEGKDDDDSFSSIEKNGNTYTFTDLHLSENSDFTFDLNLEGIQHLEHGVYIYKGTAGYDKEQTLVGVAEGNYNVDVTSRFTVNFEVTESKTVVATRKWHETTDPQRTPRETPPTVEYRLTQGVGQLEIIDEEVPLAEPPQTGDVSMLWFAMIMMSGLGLCMLNLLEKKREEA